MTGLKKLWGRAAAPAKRARRLAAALAVCAAAMALTMCDAPTMWQGVSSTASGAGALSGIRFTQSPEPQNYTEGRTPAPVMKAQISAPPAVTRLTVKWYREKDVLRLQWNKDTATEVASQSLFADGYTPEGDNTFDTAYTLTADDLTASGTYYYYAVVEDAIYSAPAMAQINTLGPAVSAVSGGASYQPTTTFVQALSATVTLPADNTAATLDYHWQGVNIANANDADTNAESTVEVTNFTRLEDGRYSYRFEYTPSLEGLAVGETYEYNLKVKNSHGTAASPQGARVTILASTEGGGGAIAPVDGDTDGDGYPDEWETTHKTDGYDPAVVNTPYGIDLSRKGAVPPGVTWFADTRIYTVQRRAEVASYRVYQSAASAETDARIVVARGAKAAITLDGVNIKSTSGSAIDIKPDAELTLLLEGTNELTANGTSAGVHVPDGATLTIDSAAGTGSTSGALYATGGANAVAIYNNNTAAASTAISGGAGIGGNTGEAAGNITIAGGAVYAYAEYAHVAGEDTFPGAGIGSGACAAGATIRIQGGVVVAYSKSGTEMEKGGVTVQHAWSGAGIGNGAGLAGNPKDTTIDITGGTVIAGSASVGVAGTVLYAEHPEDPDYLPFLPVNGIGDGWMNHTPSIPVGYTSASGVRSSGTTTITIGGTAVVLSTSINYGYNSAIDGTAGVLAADTVFTVDKSYLDSLDFTAYTSNAQDWPLTTDGKSAIYAEARRRSADVMALGMGANPLAAGAFTLTAPFTVPAGATLTVPPGWTLYLNDNALNGSSGSVSGNISPGKPTVQ